MAEYHDVGWIISRPDKDEQLLVRLVVPDGMSLPPTLELQVDAKDFIGPHDVWTPIELLEPDARIQTRPVR